MAPDALGEVLPKVTVAVLSPGIPLNGEFVRRIQAAGVPVFSEVEVAYRICKAPIVALTGTKGKSTTTALIGALFRDAGHTTHVGGNIGNALIAETAVAKPAGLGSSRRSHRFSSSRSARSNRASPAIINITPDHLDRYLSMDEYAEAKFRIFANQGPGDTFVGNLDDPIVAAAPGRRQHAHPGPRALVCARTHRQTTLYMRNESAIVYAPPTGDPRPVEIMNVSEIPLHGAHNVDNVMAAILVALAAGIEPHRDRRRRARLRRCTIAWKRSSNATASPTSTTRRRRIPAP